MKKKNATKPWNAILCAMMYARDDENTGKAIKIGKILEDSSLSSRTSAATDERRFLLYVIASAIVAC